MCNVRLKMQITNYELQITNLKLFFQCFVFLCVLCTFAGNSFAQTNLDVLAEKIARGNTEQKRDALFQIRNLETKEASRIAVAALRDSNETVRATAAFSIIFLPKDEALQVLLPLLNDKKELVRRETAYALGKVRNRDAINFLIQIFQKDKISDVRNAAIVALGEIGDASAVDALITILQKKPKSEDEFLRRSAARSIGQIAQIIQTNETKVLTPEKILLDKYNLIEKPKYFNLTATFPTFRTANNILIQTLQNQKEFDDVKREAAFALGEIADKSAIPVLQTNLTAKDYYLAEISQESLRKIAVYAEYEKFGK